MPKLHLTFILLTVALGYLVYLEAIEYSEQYRAQQGTLIDFNSYK